MVRPLSLFFLIGFLLASVEPAVRAEILVGAAVRNITPDPLLPVSGGMGAPNPAKEKRGELTAPGNRVSQGGRFSRGRLA